MAKGLTSQQRRTFRTRNKLRQVNVARSGQKLARPRLSVHRTGKGIYAQVIDDVRGVTLAAASSMDKELKLKNGGNKEAAHKVGKLVAERAKKAGVTLVQFDRGGYVYHGRVKAVADGAREAGLEF
ncbi:50S ribosomal protein L18 [Micavibrio aeruginosavorus]|uniref:Large ribosomal subunit protein uL18 n=1 Tax=Micavibrio aeruginosavorus (strain ARL-13) TaxID=856793 RepID=G2KQU7_MICAA|nr:50S ribosomal protein L18 [Micavibrio aeruginosavorus]AEP10425.1 ribosomal protein L18 [Micavibrio aeruginosavorus ARL-13]